MNPYDQVIPGAIIRSRPVGMLVMEDEAGMDEKVIAVPSDALHPYYSNIQSYKDLREILLVKSVISLPITRTLSPTNGSRLRAGKMPTRPAP